MLSVYGTVSIDDVKAVKVPQDTDTYTSVPHAELITKLEEIFNDNGHAVVDSRYGLAKKGNQLFGVMSVGGSNNVDYGYTIGFRNSYDKSLALGLVAGARVFVCSNLCFSGDIKQLRKHTSGLDLDRELEKLFKTVVPSLPSVINKLNGLRSHTLNELELRGSIMRLAENNIVPFSHTGKVLEDVHSGTDFPNDRKSEYGVVMGATNIMKKYSAARQAEGWQNLATIYGI